MSRMGSRPIIDAGPSLTFFSLNKERLLFAALGSLSVPETVVEEIRRKSSKDRNFAPASRVLDKLPPTLWKVLSDEVTPELNSVVHRISSMPMADRITDGRDLGELMVIAHAVVIAEGGTDAFVFIEDGGGARIARRQSSLLERRRKAGEPVGALKLINTQTVLKRAVIGGLIKDRAEMRKLYADMRLKDGALVPIDDTDLLSRALWKRAPGSSQ